MFHVELRESACVRQFGRRRGEAVLASFAIVESLSKRSHSRESGNPLLNPWKHKAENWIPAPSTSSGP